MQVRLSRQPGFFSKIMPFIITGVLLIAALAAFILFSYLLFFGFLIGLVLYVFAWIRQTISKKSGTQKSTTGQIYEHDDN